MTTKPPIIEGIKITCLDCKNDFRWVPNSTIKPKRCPRCQNLADFQRKQDSAHKIAENKKVLKNAGFYAKKEKREKHIKIPITHDKQVRIVLGTKSQAMQRADQYFSRYIRLFHSFETTAGQVCTCYTCGNIKPIKEAECGHWQRRGFKTTRFHENNARPQCNKCNYRRSGEPEKFEMKLIREIGAEKVNELKQLAQKEGEDNRIFYSEIAKKYRGKVRELLKERGIENPWKRASVC